MANMRTNTTGAIRIQKTQLAGDLFIKCCWFKAQFWAWSSMDCSIETFCLNQAIIEACAFSGSCVLRDWVTDFVVAHVAAWHDVELAKVKSEPTFEVSLLFGWRCDCSCTAVSWLLSKAKAQNRRHWFFLQQGVKKMRQSSLGTNRTLCEFAHVD